MDQSEDGQQLSFSLPKLARIRRLKRHRKFDVMRRNRSEDYILNQISEMDNEVDSLDNLSHMGCGRHLRNVKNIDGNRD